jgi:hypothetical protein
MLPRCDMTINVTLAEVWLSRSCAEKLAVLAAHAPRCVAAFGTISLGCKLKLKGEEATSGAPPATAP